MENELMMMAVIEKCEIEYRMFRCYRLYVLADELKYVLAYTIRQ